MYEEIQPDMESKDNIFGDYAEKNLIDEVRAVLEETLENISGDQKQVEKDKIVDGHGRLHHKTPHTGPAVLFFRVHLYQTSDITADMNDLDPIVSMEMEKGKNALLLIVDGGPDWSTTSSMNIYFYYRFWRKHALDFMTVTSYALGDSTYNGIEHLWVPISERFTGVKANPCAEGDSVAPCLVPGCSKEDVKKKEVEVFDRVMKEICEDYLDKFTLNDHPVAVRMIPFEEK